MPLRYRLLANPETVQDLELASEERYWEGAELLVSGRRGAGIYLLGYAAEMLLKTACFLIDGARPADRVGSRLAPIRTWAKSMLPTIPYENYHSLWFWLHVLRKKRNLKGVAIPQQFDAQLVQRIHRLYGIWIVNMRYKPDEALHQEAESTLSDVAWIRTKKLSLVR